jgi:ubiquitin-conjugating enzyme E2 J1
MASPLEEDIFEWHFCVAGPPGTEFEVGSAAHATARSIRPPDLRRRRAPWRPLQGGIYHGRILLPPEYPFKPPSFMMLSPSGWVLCCAA